MPRAEVGSTRYLNNKLKSKGLQRLRWYCQVCERQMRDENGFKMHTQTESHVRQMLLVGENSHKFISDYSAQFKRDFLQLLRTSHGEKKVNVNHFYQEYIHNKEHVHMNATRWPSLTEFAKFLGREGICRVEEGERGLEMAWIDNSPESLRRQDAIRKKERQDKGDEELEQRLIAEQVERARRNAEERMEEDEDDQTRELQREDGEKIKLSFATKTVTVPLPASPSTAVDEQPGDPQESGTETIELTDPDTISILAAPEKLSLKMGNGGKPKNVFATASRKNAFANAKPIAKVVPPKPMSEAERIMKEEIEKKRIREASGLLGTGAKRQKI